MSIDINAKKEESDFMQIHIGPEVNCDDVEKVENHNKIICCKCSSKEPLILNKKKEKKAILLYKVCTEFLCHTLKGDQQEKTDSTYFKCSFPKQTIYLLNFL